MIGEKDTIRDHRRELLYIARNKNNREPRTMTPIVVANQTSADKPEPNYDLQLLTRVLATLAASLFRQKVLMNVG